MSGTVIANSKRMDMIFHNTKRGLLGEHPMRQTSFQSPRFRWIVKRVAFRRR